MKHTLYITIFLFLVFSGCTKKANDQKASLPEKFDNGVLFLNEGNFNYANASVDYLDFGMDTVFESVFFAVNGFMPGDVLQSAYADSSVILFVVNNSGKIIVVDRETLKYKATVSGLTSPRYVTKFSNKYFVTDLYSPYITVVNDITFEPKGTIKVGHSTGEIILHDGYLYTVSWRKDNKLWKIDPINLSVADSLVVGYEPNSLEVDKDGYLWVLCDGGVEPDTLQDSLPVLVKVEPENMDIEKIYFFRSKKMSPTDLEMNSKRDMLYFLNTSWTLDDNVFGIYRMSVYDSQLPEQAFIPQNDRRFYSLKTDSQTDEIYVSDVKDFMQASDVYRFTSDGRLINIYPAGVITGDFLFVR